MRRSIVLILALLTACVALPPSKNDASLRQVEDFVGRWVGKWDNTWCVQFTVTQNSLTKAISVLYEWEENLGRPLHSQQLAGYLENNILKVCSAIQISLPERNLDKATAYGRFPKPRTAALVREATQRCGAGRYAEEEIEMITEVVTFREDHRRFARRIRSPAP